MRLESQLSRMNCQTFSTGLTLRRQQNDGDIGRHEEARGQVPAGLIDQEDGVGTVEAVDCCDESDAIPQIEIFIIPRATLK